MVSYWLRIVARHVRIATFREFSKVDMQGLRLQPPFVSQFLLGLFQDTVVDDFVQGKLFVDKAAADVLVEHDLNAVQRNREVDGVAGAEEIVGSAYDIRLAFEPGGKADFDRFLFVVSRELHSQDHSFEKSLGAVRVFL
jgi:hypothetical protein